VCAGYNGRQVLTNVDFTVHEGSVTVLLGPNGSGKSTLLKTLARTLTPSAGKVLLDGNDIHRQPTRTVAQQLGILPQSPTAPDGLTLRELVGLGRFPYQSLMRQWSRHDEAAVEEAMAVADVATFADRPVDALSGGQRQRCWIAMVLAQETDLLLLDEPTNHLDMESCDTLLEAINNFKGVLIMVTHNEMFLHTLAKRLIVFDHDKIDVFEGSYQRFLDKGGWETPDNISNPVNDKRKKGRGRTETRRRRSEIISERSRTLKPLEQMISQIEDRIDAHEKKIKTCADSMQEASRIGNGDQISDLSRTIHASETAIEALFDEMEKLSVKFEERKQYFEQALRDNKE